MQATKNCKVLQNCRYLEPPRKQRCGEIPMSNAANAPHRSRFPSNGGKNTRCGQRAQQSSEGTAQFAIDRGAARRRGGRSGHCPAIPDKAQCLPIRAVRYAETFARGDKQPVAELTASELARLTGPGAGRGAADQPASAVLRLRRRRIRHRFYRAMQQCVDQRVGFVDVKFFLRLPGERGCAGARAKPRVRRPNRASPVRRWARRGGAATVRTRACGGAR